MRNLETNDWLTLNSIIYNIYTTEDLTRMRKHFLEQLKMIIDFDSADFYLASGQAGQRNLIRPVYLNCEGTDAELEESLDYSRGLLHSGRSIVYRETDIISDDKRMATEYYQKIYRANGWHFSLQMVLAREEKLLGAVTFYRTIGKDDFLYDDIFIVDLLKDHLSYRLAKEMEHEEGGAGKYTVAQAAEAYDLTRRECDILRELLAGLDNEEICGELCISVNTLKKHILNIYRKLGINNRVQLFKMIRERE